MTASKSGKAGGVINPIYVISGKDKFLVSSECERLLDKLLPVEQRSMALSLREGERVRGCV